MIRLEKIQKDSFMHDVVEEKKEVCRPYMLRSYNEICMLLKRGRRLRKRTQGRWWFTVKGRRLLWRKGRECCRGWEKDSGMRAAAVQPVMKRGKGKRKASSSPMPEDDLLVPNATSSY